MGRWIYGHGQVDYIAGRMDLGKWMSRWTWMDGFGEVFVDGQMDLGRWVGGLDRWMDG